MSVERNKAIDILFKEAMIELKDIKKEIINMNQKLTLTIERQAVSNDNIDKIDLKLAQLEEDCRQCTARRSYESKTFLLKDASALLALALSLIALYNIFFK